MIPRLVSKKLLDMAKAFPVVSLTGPRQSGKTTLVQALFPGYEYVSLEDPDMQDFATDDPRGFLGRFGGHGVILDEIQKEPHLFSYIQGSVDREDRPGQYVLTGSQNFLLMQNITQTLAGRVAVLNLPPLSLAELQEAGNNSASWEEWVFKGGYPRIFKSDINPSDYFPSYVQTYLDRDVRQGANVLRLSDFNRFLGLCATRTGRVLNKDALAKDLAINIKTANNWLSALESSYILYLLKPYFKNIGKRLIKSPKLYFWDTGLASNLLGIEHAEDIDISKMKGELFENAVTSELCKYYCAKGKQPTIYYLRDSNANEIDLIIEKGAKAHALIEVKSGKTYKPGYFSTIDSMGDDLEVPRERRFVVYGGDESFETSHGNVLAYEELSALRELI